MSISPENILLKNMVNILKSQMLKNFETDFEAEVWQTIPNSYISWVLRNPSHLQW